MPSPEQQRIVDMIQTMRRERGLTYSEIGRRAHLSGATIWRVSQDPTFVRWSSAQKIKAVYDRLIGGQVTK